MRTEPRYASLSDYLRVIRRYRLMIVLVALACLGAAVLLSARSEEVYEAEASIQLRDVAQDLALIGRNNTPATNAAVQGSAVAERVTSPEAGKEAQRLLGVTTSPDVLRSKVSGNVELRTNFIVVTANAGEPRTAQRLADAFAQATATIVTREQRTRFRNARDTLRRQYREFIRGDGNDLAEATQVVTRASYEQALAQLDSLQQFSKPAVVQQKAELPGTPVSPKPVRNGVLGLIFGLLVGIGAAFLRDNLDRRLRGTQEIRTELGLPVLGFISDGGMGTVSFGRNGQKSMPNEDVEAARILRANLSYLDVDRPPKLIAVTSALPEEGKSTVAAALATASALAGKLTVLIETDLRRPSVSTRLGIERQPGLTDYLIGEAEPKDILQVLDLDGRDAAAGATPQLVVIAAGRQVPRPAELLESQRMKALLEQVREAYDVVVLDTSPMLPVVDTLGLLPQADAIALCVRSRQTTRDQAHALMSALGRVPKRPMGVVVTGVSRQEDEAYSYYSYAYASKA